MVNITKEIVERERDRHINRIIDFLKQYEMRSFFLVYYDLYRSIEEFINIIEFGNLDTNEKEKILSISLSCIDYPNQLLHDLQPICKLYGKDIYKRIVFLEISLCGFLKAIELKQNEYYMNSLHINTNKDILQYLKERRRSFNTILHLIPQYCTGEQGTSPKSILSEIGPYIEFSLIGINSMSHQLVLFDLLDDYNVESNNGLCHASEKYYMLDENALEVTRFSFPGFVQKNSSINDTKQYKKIFSAEEFIDSILIIENSGTQYNYSKHLVDLFDATKKLNDYIVDDYFIKISTTDFDRLFMHLPFNESSVLKNNFIFKGSSFYDALYSKSPFIRCGDFLISDINQVIKCVFHHYNTFLNRSKKIQINSGFEFEKQLKEILKNYHFNVLDIKRISRKEFDVVAKKDNKLYNFQCKNNFFDTSKLNTNMTLFVRTQKRLLKYYKKSLQKEKDREYLLAKETGVHEIRHIVISKFPIISSDDRILGFNQFCDYIKNNNGNI